MRCFSSFRRRKQLAVTQKGIALIAVTLALAVITTVTMEFNYSTNVDYASAANARDAMRAHFLAKSVMNMSRLLLKVQQLMDSRKSKEMLKAMGLPDAQIADFISMLEVPMCGTKEEVADMANLAHVDVSNMKGLGLDYGLCRVETFAAEDGKINVNCAASSGQTPNNIAGALAGLVGSPAYDLLFQERDGDGQFTDRQTFIKAVLDYVDRDEAGFGGPGSAEDYGYEAMREAYRAKNYYIDSVDELQLVRGMDDRKWEIFGPELTAYGGCKVNVSATQSRVQIMGLLIQTAKDKQDPVLLDPRKLILLADRVAQARALSYPFETLDDFIKFVANPDEELGLASATGTGAGQQLGLPAVDGLQLDKNELTKIATTGSRRVYRIVAAAQVGRVEKRIIGVWDQRVVNQNNREPDQRQGAWVYWREE